ncbi:MAG: hypothetical protein ABEI11_02315 [Haloarculaceae archaeon]
MTDRGSVPIDPERGNIEPHEAFALLSDPNRFDIIATLAEASREALPFNDLYERSTFEDSGQFNYHLDRLVGPFVRETDEGYGLRHAARLAYRLAVSGLLSDRGEAEITTLGTTCVRCETGELAAVYEGDRFWVRCRDCGRRATVAPFPPRALANHDPDRAPAAFDRYTLGSVVRASENVCPWCASRLSASLEPADDGWPAVDWVIRRGCDHCQGWIHTRVHDLVRLHPAVIAFYHDRGVDALGWSFWAAERAMADRTTVDADADGWAATVTLARDDGALTLGLAADLRVSTTEVVARETEGR